VHRRAGETCSRRSGLVSPLLKVPPASRGEPRIGVQGEPAGGGSTVLTLSCALSAQVSDMLHDGVEVRVEFAGGDTEREDAQLL